MEKIEIMQDKPNKYDVTILLKEIDIRDFEKWSNLEAAHFKELKKNVKLVAQGKEADTKWKFGDKLKKMSSVVSKDDFDKAEYA